jgi:hypothetical protein
LLQDPYVESIVDHDIKTGKHNNPQKVPLYFTDAYFHKPSELEQELLDAQFHDVKLFAIEGPSFLFSSLKETVENKLALEKLLYFLEKLEHEPGFIGATSHLMAVGRK